MATEPDKDGLITSLEDDPQAAVVTTADTNTDTAPSDPPDTTGETEEIEETEEKGDPKPSEPSEDDAAILEFLKEDLGINTGKYASAAEAIKGARELTQLALRRNDDADYGRQLRDQIGGKESQILALLQGGEQPKTSKKADVADEPPEYNPAWQYQITTDEAGNWVSVKGAKADVVEKYRTHLEWREARLNELVRDPGKFFDAHLGKKTAEIVEKAQQAVKSDNAADNEKTAIQTWQEKNAEQLFADPDGPQTNENLTPFGRLVSERYHEEIADGIADPVKALKRAAEWATLKQGNTTPARKKLPSRALRKPAIAAKGLESDGNLSVGELFEKFKDDDNAFEKIVALRNKLAANT